MNPFNTNESIIDAEKQYIAPFQKIPYYPIAFEHGNGALLYDYSGKEYIDFLSSASTSNAGHNNAEIAQAVCEQMNRLPQYAMAYFATREPVLLAKKLCELTGCENMQVAYSCTGSASIDGAIKVARAYTGRSKIISFNESYHGSTFGAMSVSAISLNMRRKMGPLMSDIIHFNYPNCLRCPYHQQVDCCQMDCLKEIKYAFEHTLPAEEVAAIIFEPIAGDAGLIAPPLKYVRALRKLCDEHGILLISDEIQQGLCRTGEWFAIHNFDIKPDLYVMGKSVGGGLPLGCLMGRREIMAALDAPAHLFSMSGNSTACTAGLKMLEIFERDNMNQTVKEKGNYLMEKLRKLQEKYDIIGDVRGMGLSIAVDLVKNRATMEKHAEATAKISSYCLEHGLVLIFVGQNALRIQPPLIITTEQLDRGVSTIEAGIQAYLNNEIEVNTYMQGW